MSSQITNLFGDIPLPPPTSIHFSSKSVEWATPQDFFDKLDAEFHFETDVCSTHENAKCENHYTEEEDGLSRKWTGVCWMNPITCFISPTFLNVLYDKDLYYLQNKQTVNFRVLPYEIDLERWLAFCVQRMQPCVVPFASTETETKREFENKALGRKEEVFDIRQRLINETTKQQNIQSQKEAEEYVFTLGLDAAGLGDVQGYVESFMRVLWLFRQRANSGSFYPFIEHQLSGNCEIQHVASLYDLQHKQGALRTRNVVQEQATVCSTCGLSVCIKIGSVWCNPPYARNVMAKWIEKAYTSSLAGATVVCLIPARTDTKVWHNYIWDGEAHRPRKGVQIRYIEGRLRFGGCKDSAPFPSAVVIFRPVHDKSYEIGSGDEI